MADNFEGYNPLPLTSREIPGASRLQHNDSTNTLADLMNTPGSNVNVGGTVIPYPNPLQLDGADSTSEVSEDDGNDDADNDISVDDTSDGGDDFYSPTDLTHNASSSNSLKNKMDDIDLQHQPSDGKRRTNNNSSNGSNAILALQHQLSASGFQNPTSLLHQHNIAHSHSSLLPNKNNNNNNANNNTSSDPQSSLPVPILTKSLSGNANQSFTPTHFDTPLQQPADPSVAKLLLGGETIPDSQPDSLQQQSQQPTPDIIKPSNDKRHHRHHYKMPEAHAHEFLHHSYQKDSAIQAILATKSPGLDVKDEKKPKTAIHIAIDEVQAGVDAIKAGTPKPIPTFTRAHFNTNWITDTYNASSSHSHRSRKPRQQQQLELEQQLSQQQLLQANQSQNQTGSGGLDELDERIAATFSSPTQARQEFDDTFDVEKNMVSQQFLNCLKLRREFLFTPAYVDRRFFDTFARPDTYEPALDGHTIQRPAFDALTTTSTQTVSVIAPCVAPIVTTLTNPSQRSSFTAVRQHAGSHPHTPNSNPLPPPTVPTSTSPTPHKPTAAPPSPIAAPRSSSGFFGPTTLPPMSDSGRVSVGSVHGATIASPRHPTPNHQRSPSMAGHHNVNTHPTHASPTSNNPQAPTQLVTTTVTTIDPEVYNHIDAFLSAELINSPHKFAYGFVNGVMQVFPTDAVDIIDYQRALHQQKRHRQQTSDLNMIDPKLLNGDSIVNSDLMRINRRLQREKSLEDKFRNTGLQHEGLYRGYCHDIYHLALHQHHVKHQTDDSTGSGLLSPRSTLFSPSGIQLVGGTSNDANLLSPVPDKDQQQHANASKIFSNTGTDGNGNVLLPNDPLEFATSTDPRFTQYFSQYDNIVPVPSWNDFCDALIYILQTAGNGPCKSWAYQRLTNLDTQKSLHTQLNQELERAQSKAIPHRDFYNVRKIDNHVHHSACMNQKHLLRFIKRKLREPEATTFPVITRDGNKLTLDQVFKSLNLTAYDLSIDTLDMHAAQTFHRFDKFNAKYSPIQETRLREIFLKYHNNIKGQYLAEITREVFEDLHTNKYQFAEYRVSIYGKDLDEWDSLADWIVDNKLISPNVRWMIQIPRLYRIYKSQGLIDNFQDMLTNIFLPIFHCTLYPHQNPKLHQLLSLLVGFDTVDDESVRTRFFDKNNTPPPQRYTDKEDPHYGVFLYYLYANLRALNHLRELVGLNTFALRPHAGEAGDEANVAAAFLTSRGINHGLTLHRTPPIQYLYYLAQVGISMSPLSNNLLFLEYQKNPFPKFFNRGLNVTLSTDDPLMIHVTKEPLIEEYSIASQVWGLSHLDLCEIAKNSVLQSGFEHPYKVHWLGNSYYKHAGTESNDIRASNVPDIRAQYRWEVLYREHLLLTTYAHHNNKVDIDLIDPQY